MNLKATFVPGLRPLVADIVQRMLDEGTRRKSHDNMAKKCILLLLRYRAPWHGLEGWRVLDGFHTNGYHRTANIA